MLAPLSVSRAICCGRAAYLCYRSPLLNIMTKQNSKNNIHPAALQMRKADKLFIYYQLNKLGLSGRVCKKNPVGALGGSDFCQWCWAGWGGHQGSTQHATLCCASPGVPIMLAGQRPPAPPRSGTRTPMRCGAAVVGCQLLASPSSGTWDRSEPRAPSLAAQTRALKPSAPLGASACPLGLASLLPQT